MMTLEWSTDKILQFIQEYRNRPVLWDRDHTHFRVGDRKMKAWTEMAAIFNTETWELKKKMNSLLSSYRRERLKARNGRSSDGVFTSSWFAYKSFNFLQDKCIERQNSSRYIQDDHEDTTDLDTIEESQMELIKTEDPEETTVYVNEEDLTMLNGIEEVEYKEEEYASPVKRRRTTEGENARRGHETSSSSSTNHHRTRDDDAVFGEYISGKMRNFDRRTKCVVHYLISNILFQADMGRYREDGFDCENLIGSLMFKKTSTSCVNQNNSSN